MQIGVLRIKDTRAHRPLQDLFNKRISGLERSPRVPVAEIIAASMLVVFTLWVALAYVGGWWRLDVVFAWFWWRHLDAGLHSAAHGDFRYHPVVHKGLLGVYSLLSRRAVEYYNGQASLKGCGFTQHLWHHVHTNDPARDPDWTTMSGEPWVRRHWSAKLHPHHIWQCHYWIPVTALVEPLLELLQVVTGVIEAFATLLEPPSKQSPFHHRVGRACATVVEFLINPGYQGLMFFVQPWWHALGVVILARAVARLVLFPFSEVQHYMPENLQKHAHLVQEEWIVTQLRHTANLRLDNPFARTLDFLMFHGDTHQIEHHMWPAMSFVHLKKAAAVVRAICEENGLPYHEVGYWEGYQKIWHQIRDHACTVQPMRKLESKEPLLEVECCNSKASHRNYPSHGSPRSTCSSSASSSVGPRPRRDAHSRSSSCSSSCSSSRRSQPINRMQVSSTDTSHPLQKNFKHACDPSVHPASTLPMASPKKRCYPEDSLQPRNKRRLVSKDKHSVDKG